MPNIVYTVAERVQMVRQREQGLSYRRIVDHFAAANPSRPIPSISTVERIVRLFYKTGNVDPGVKKVVYPGKRLTQDTKLSILLKAQEYKIQKIKSPIMKIAQEVNVSKSMVWKILRTEKCGMYKHKMKRQAKEDENQTQLILSHNMKENLNADPSLIEHICVSDECTVQLVGVSNRRKNNQQKLNVWVGMIADKLIGPFFINGNITSDKYLQMLQKEVVPVLRAAEARGLVIRFQRDGTPAHFDAAVKTYLNEAFPGCWIRSGDAVQWPPQSPDLSPLNCSLWTYLKNRVYAKGQIEDLQMLRDKVSEVLALIDPQTIVAITDAFCNHLRHWIAVKTDVKSEI